VPDSGGPGRFRGGLALERHLRFRAAEATLQIRSDRRDHPPWGLSGGRPGTPSNTAIRRADGREERFPAKFLTTVKRGDVFKVRLAGAGGHGDPFARDPELVLADIREGKLTAAAARRDYGVVVAGEPAALDRAATAALRARG
jgi:N-methylhydantoinase B